MVSPIIGSSLIGAGSSILGGLFGSSGAKKARKQQQAQFEQNMAMQKEFAQNGIRWKVNDAKEAGLHPLYALSGGTNGYIPSSTSVGSDNSLGNALSNAGQDISRSLEAKNTQPERTQNSTALMNLGVERAQLEKSTTTR